MAGGPASYLRGAGPDLMLKRLSIVVVYGGYMRFSGLRKAGVLFVVLLVGAVCALIQGSGVVDAAAEDRKLEDVAACWVTGLPETSSLGEDPEESYGGKMEFVVDFSDLQGAVVGDFQLEPDLDFEDDDGRFWVRSRPRSRVLIIYGNRIKRGLFFVVCLDWWTMRSI